MKEPKFWHTVKCNVVRPTNYQGNGDITHFYHHSAMSTVDEIGLFPAEKLVQGNITDAIKATEDAADFVNDLLSGKTPECSAADYEGRHDSELWLGRLIAEARATAAKAKLSECQKICVAKCMTMKLLYAGDQGAFTRYGSPYEIADRGEGMCTEFSSLGKFLINSMGVPAESVSGQGHEFVRVKLGRTEYNIENEFMTCDFFPLN